MSVFNIDLPQSLNITLNDGFQPFPLHIKIFHFILLCIIDIIFILYTSVSREVILKLTSSSDRMVNLSPPSTTNAPNLQFGYWPISNESYQLRDISPSVFILFFLAGCSYCSCLREMPETRVQSMGMQV